MVLHGVGGPQAGAVNYIYSQLLQQFNIDAYRYIHINQIGVENNEVIIKEGKKININVRFPAREDFEQLSDFDQNVIRLEIIHIGLCRIAAYENKIDIGKLNEIKAIVLEKKFDFSFLLKKFENKKNPEFIGSLFIKPQNKRFDFFASIKNGDTELCNLPIFSGGTSDFYFSNFFSKGKWTAKGELIISGSSTEVEIRINTEACTVEFVNLTRYEKPPLLELMRSDLSEEEKSKAYRDWIHSLPPGMAAIVDSNPN